MRVQRLLLSIAVAGSSAVTGCGGTITSAESEAGAVDAARAGRDAAADKTTADVRTDGATHGRDGGGEGGALDDATAGPDGGHGDGGIGSPCTANDQCRSNARSGATGVCLGGPFVGGYCSYPVTECDPGLCRTGSCEGYGGFQDIQGDPVMSPEICPAPCGKPSDCRPGYWCCPSNAGGGGDVCLPPSVCGCQNWPKGFCGSSSDCCSGICGDAGTCACVFHGGACTSTAQCCGGDQTCKASVCCTNRGYGCMSASDCCSHACKGGMCS